MILTALQSKTFDYLEFEIICSEYQLKDRKHFEWEMYKDKKFLLCDCRTVSGEILSGINQALNDAKKNIDILKRLKLL